MASGYTTTTALAELIPEITLQVDYIYQNASLGRSLVTFKDITSQPGTTVEFPRFTEVAASTGVAETGTPTSHAMDLSMPTLTIARRSVYVGPGDLATKGATGNTAAEIGVAMGMAQVKAIDALIFSVVTATTDWSTGTGATNAAMGLGYIQDGLLLLEKNEVDDMIVGVLHPHQWDPIRALFTPVFGATNAYQAGAAQLPSGVSDEMIRTGKGNFYGIDWFVTNRIGSGTVNATANCYNGLLFAKRGIGYGFSWLNESGIEAERDAANALTKLVLNWADSAGVIYDSAVCKLYSTSS